MDVWVAEERVRLAHSQAVRRRRTARGFEERSKQYLILILDNKKVIPFFFVFLGEMVYEAVIEVFFTKMGITSSGSRGLVDDSENVHF
jgi:hypothetical protein